MHVTRMYEAGKYSAMTGRFSSYYRIRRCSFLVLSISIIRCLNIVFIYVDGELRICAIIFHSVSNGKPLSQQNARFILIVIFCVDPSPGPIVLTVFYLKTSVFFATITTRYYSTHLVVENLHQSGDTKLASTTKIIAVRS